MGTRVDFYVGRGEGAEWLGSYPWDGYPDGVFHRDDDVAIFNPTSPPSGSAWRQWVSAFLSKGGDRSTLPEHGWPWPWEDSGTTDFAYTWDDGVIYGSNFGSAWFRLDPAHDNWGPPDDEDESEGESEGGAVFPDMSTRQSVTYGQRSGVMIVGG